MKDEIMARARAKAKRVMDKWCAIPGHPKNRTLTDLESRFAVAYYKLERVLRRHCHCHYCAALLDEQKQEARS